MRSLASRIVQAVAASPEATIRADGLRPPTYSAPRAPWLPRPWQGQRKLWHICGKESIPFADRLRCCHQVKAIGICIIPAKAYRFLVAQ